MAKTSTRLTTCSLLVGVAGLRLTQCVHMPGWRSWVCVLCVCVAEFTRRTDTTYAPTQGVWQIRQGVLHSFVNRLFCQARGTCCSKIEVEVEAAAEAEAEAAAAAARVDICPKLTPRSALRVAQPKLPPRRAARHEVCEVDQIAKWRVVVAAAAEAAAAAAEAAAAAAEAAAAGWASPHAVRQLG